jgi:GNAT superfamily N-acetyltransferase
VHEVASAVYDRRQVNAWAPAQPDIEKWLPRLTAFDTFVAVDANDDVIAWIAMSPIGYVDMLFCLPEAIGRGAAAQLYIAIEARAIERGVRRMTTHASLIAQPFFAIRAMVQYDLPFLMGAPEHLDAYLSRFAPGIPPHLRSQLAAAVGYMPSPHERVA